jgi:hypothetical protein
MAGWGADARYTRLVQQHGGTGHQWGLDRGRQAYGKRNGVESVNRNLKRGQREAIADADTRQVRGNTFTYLVVAVAAVVENLRRIISFFQERLAVRTVTSKNRDSPSTYSSATQRTRGQEERPPE